MLNKREALLIKKISNELEKAREFNRQGNKRAALQCLKRKKLYESQCEVVANQQLKLQEQMIVLEGSKARRPGACLLQTLAIFPGITTYSVFWICLLSANIANAYFFTNLG